METERDTEREYITERKYLFRRDTERVYVCERVRES